jgi:hypothetical protein
MELNYFKEKTDRLNLLTLLALLRDLFLNRAFLFHIATLKVDYCRIIVDGFVLL